MIRKILKTVVGIISIAAGIMKIVVAALILYKDEAQDTLAYVALIIGFSAAFIMFAFDFPFKGYDISDFIGKETAT